jgi:hypothetical protein
MTNEEFIKALLSRLVIKNYINDQKGVQEEIAEFLQQNNLQVINTKDQLLDYYVENVIDYYDDWRNCYQNKYGKNIPLELTKEQGQYLLELANRLNSRQALPDWDDIYEAIEQWLGETYAT